MGQKNSKARGSAAGDEGAGAKNRPRQESDCQSREGTLSKKRKWGKKRRYSLPGNDDGGPLPSAAARGSTLSLSPSGAPQTATVVTQMPHDSSSGGAVLLSYTRSSVGSQEDEEARRRRVQRAKSTAAAWRHARPQPEEEAAPIAGAASRSRSVKDVRGAGFIAQREDKDAGVKRDKEDQDPVLLSSGISRHDASRQRRKTSSSPRDRKCDSVREKSANEMVEVRLDSSSPSTSSSSSSSDNRVAEKRALPVATTAKEGGGNGVAIAADVGAPLKMGEGKKEGERVEGEKRGASSSSSVVVVVGPTQENEEWGRMEINAKEGKREKAQFGEGGYVQACAEEEKGKARVHDKIAGKGTSATVPLSSTPKRADETAPGRQNKGEEEKTLSIADPAGPKTGPKTEEEAPKEEEKGGREKKPGAHQRAEIENGEDCQERKEEDAEEKQHGTTTALAARSDVRIAKTEEEEGLHETPPYGITDEAYTNPPSESSTCGGGGRESEGSPTVESGEVEVTPVPKDENGEEKTKNNSGTKFELKGTSAPSPPPQLSPLDVHRAGKKIEESIPQVDDADDERRDESSLPSSSRVKSLQDNAEEEEVEEVLFRAEESGERARWGDNDGEIEAEEEEEDGAIGFKEKSPPSSSSISDEKEIPKSSSPASHQDMGVADDQDETEEEAAPDMMVANEAFDPPLESASRASSTCTPCSSASSSPSSSPPASPLPGTDESLEPGQKSFREWESLVESCIDEEEEEDEEEDFILEEPADSSRHHFAGRHSYRPDAPSSTSSRAFQWRPPPLGCSSDDLDGTTDDDTDASLLRRRGGNPCYDSLEDLSRMLKEDPRLQDEIQAPPASSGKRVLPAIPTDTAQQIRALKILRMQEAAQDRKRSTSSSSTNPHDSLEDVRAYFPEGRDCGEEDSALMAAGSDKSSSSVSRRRLLPIIPGAAAAPQKGDEEQPWMKDPSPVKPAAPVNIESYAADLPSGPVKKREEDDRLSSSRHSRHLDESGDSGFISLDFGNASGGISPKKRPVLSPGKSSDFLWVGFPEGEGEESKEARPSVSQASSSSSSVVRRPKNHDRLMEFAKRRASAPPGSVEQQRKQSAPPLSSRGAASTQSGGGAKEKIRRRKSDKSVTTRSASQSACHKKSPFPLPLSPGSLILVTHFAR